MSLANRQRAVAVPIGRLRRLALRVLAAARPEGGELSVVLVDDPTIAHLNATYRGTPRPTDVLAFPQLDVPAGTQRGRGFASPERRGVSGGPAKPVPPTPIGDVVISMETARRQARERGRPIEEEVGALLVHGVLHLLGYDHERSAAAAREMFAREREVALAAGLPAMALGDRPRRPVSRGAAPRRAHRRRVQGGRA
ncbi:MAG TPA: rRNA maturation RNase YbeY [Thermodesulfobacteriota bacterium]